MPDYLKTYITSYWESHCSGKGEQIENRFVSEIEYGEHILTLVESITGGLGTRNQQFLCS